MDEQSQDVQLEPTYSSSAPMRDIDQRICRKQWTIRTGGEKGSGIYVLIARHDDDDDGDDNDDDINFQQFRDIVMGFFFFYFWKF